MIWCRLQEYATFFNRIHNHRPIVLALFFLILGINGERSMLAVAASGSEAMTEDYAHQLGEDFGLVVGEIDEEIREFLGLQRTEGVVVFEVIGGKPAELAGVKPRSIIQEINQIKIKTLIDFGTALKEALPLGNFSLATYEPANLNDQGVTGGINFHFVRIEKT